MTVGTMLVGLFWRRHKNFSPVPRKCSG